MNLPQRSFKIINTSNPQQVIEVEGQVLLRVQFTDDNGKNVDMHVTADTFYHYLNEFIKVGTILDPTISQ